MYYNSFGSGFKLESVDERIKKVSQAIADLGFNGITRFDYEEPEYATLFKLSEKIPEEKILALLGICAGIVDYQLSGNAQLFWKSLEQVTMQFPQVEDINDVRNLLDTFMEEPVNGRLNNRKRMRLKKLFDRGFAEWFVTNYGVTTPEEVWRNVAFALDNPMQRKTIVFSMKVYDLVNLIVNNEYLDFPLNIPIPCDVHIERVAHLSGLIQKGVKSASVLSAWVKVAQQVSNQIGHPVSLLRIDSIIWQLGQIISKEKQEKRRSRTAIVSYLKKLDFSTSQATTLANELTYAV